MIEIRPAAPEDLRLPNEAFTLYGRLLPRYEKGRWSWETELFPEPETLCFPDEPYTVEDGTFLGAYEGDSCVGLALLQPGPFRYLYLADLKVCGAYRGTGVGRALIQTALALALREDWRGIYTVGQDNNLAACLFYLKTGFRIGGLDTEVYRGTKQEGKADVFFYLDGGETHD